MEPVPIATAFCLVACAPTPNATEPIASARELAPIAVPKSPFDKACTPKDVEAWPFLFLASAKLMESVSMSRPVNSL